MKGQPLRVNVFAGADSSATLYEDDGHTLQYRSGAFAKRRFAQTRTRDAAGQDERATIQVGAAEGTYRPSARSLVLAVRWSGTPRAVSLASGTAAAAPLERGDEKAFEGRDTGWTVASDGTLLVKFPDRFEGATVTIAR
jgi:hypothetical protein